MRGRAAERPGWGRVRRALSALGLMLAACAVHAVAGFDAGPLSWLLEEWGYNVVVVGSGVLCLQFDPAVVGAFGRVKARQMADAAE